MDEKRISIRKTAAAAGVSPSTIDDWRSGTTPTDYYAVRKLAQRLGVSFEWLLTGEGGVQNNRSPSITELFENGGVLFDGYAKVTIQKLKLREKKL